MFDIVASIRKLNLDLSNLGKSVDTLDLAIDNLASGGSSNPKYAGTVNFATASGNFSFEVGTGNGANYATYNSLIRLPSGLGLVGPDGVTKGYFDGTAGFIDMKGGFRVNGAPVLTSIDFHPTDYATISGATFTGALTAPSITTPGTITASSGVISGRVTASDATLSGRLTSLNLTVTGSTTLAATTMSGALSATTAGFSGAVTAPSIILATSVAAASAAITGNLTAATASLTTSVSALAASFGNANSVNGGLNLLTGGIEHSGYIEFTKPGFNQQRFGYIGYSSTSGVIDISNETNGGCYNFVNINGASEPKINGNAIWHTGNLNPSSFNFDGSGYVQKSAPSISADLNANSNRITNALSLSTLNGTGTALLSTDTNVNNFKIRTGPSSGFFTTTFGADGSVTMPGNLTVNSALNVTGAINANNSIYVNGNGVFKADIATHRNNSTGYMFLGNSGARYIGYDGSNYLMPGSQLILNGSQVWHAGNLNPSIYASWAASKYWTDFNGPVFNFAPKSSGMSVGDNNFGAISIQSPDYSGGAFIQFVNQNRWAVYFGLDTDNQLKVGGWSLGANAYKILHQGNCNPVVNMRMVDAGSLDSSWNVNANNYAEPYNGGVMTSLVFQGGVYGSDSTSDSRRIGGARWRYFQKQDSYGNWSTVGYA